MLTELVKYVVEKLVDKPELIVVKEFEKGQAIVIKLNVAADDLGKIIGKEGKMARVLRTLVHTASMLQGKRAVLEISKEQF